MNLLAKVAKLQKLEAEAIPVPWTYRPSGISDCGNDYSDCICAKEGGLFYDVCDEPETHLVIALRNAAPVMLACLAHIQPGDADRLKWIGEECLCSDMFDSARDMKHCDRCIGKPDCDTARRLQAMCQEAEKDE